MRERQRGKEETEREGVRKRKSREGTMGKKVRKKGRTVRRVRQRREIETKEIERE